MTTEEFDTYLKSFKNEKGEISKIKIMEELINLMNDMKETELKREIILKKAEALSLLKEYMH